MNKYLLSLLKKTTTIASGIVYVAKDVTDTAITSMEKNKILSKDEGRQFAQQIKKDVQQTQKTVKANIFAPLRGLVKELGLVTKEDLEEMLRSNRQTPKRAKSA